jgi:hypothetical protein
MIPGGGFDIAPAILRPLDVGFGTQHTVGQIGMPSNRLFFERLPADDNIVFNG